MWQSLSCMPNSFPQRLATNDLLTTLSLLWSSSTACGPLCTLRISTCSRCGGTRIITTRVESNNKQQQQELVVSHKKRTNQSESHGRAVKTIMTLVLSEGKCNKLVHVTCKEGRGRTTPTTTPTMEKFKSEEKCQIFRNGLAYLYSTCYLGPSIIHDQ
mmetsp:Transcript_38848/g.93917  ORF Transcript_38848/g.93917 Transcript_38848/m.93917 type:complete len:158 (+) Transcript_38848:664-1137(+)